MSFDAWFGRLVMLVALGSVGCDSDDPANPSTAASGSVASSSTNGAAGGGGVPAGAGGAGGEAANGGAAVGGGGGAPAAAGGAGGAGGQQPCVGEVDTDACSECCATTYSQGFSAFILTFYSCGCSGPDSCYAPCAMSLCGPNMAPKGAECVECVQEALSAGGDCDGDPGFSNCENQPSCTEYAACIQSCP